MPMLRECWPKEREEHTYTPPLSPPYRLKLDLDRDEQYFPKMLGSNFEPNRENEANKATKGLEWEIPEKTKSDEEKEKN